MSYDGLNAVHDLLQVLSEEERADEPAHSALDGEGVGVPGYQSGESQADARKHLQNCISCEASVGLVIE